MFIKQHDKKMFGELKIILSGCSKSDKAIFIIINLFKKFRKAFFIVEAMLLLPPQKSP